MLSRFGSSTANLHNDAKKKGPEGPFLNMRPQASPT